MKKNLGHVDASYLSGKGIYVLPLERGTGEKETKGAADRREIIASSAYLYQRVRPPERDRREKKTPEKVKRGSEAPLPT